MAREQRSSMADDAIVNFQSFNSPTYITPSAFARHKTRALSQFPMTGSLRELRLRVAE
jgi:hypothetical protein